MLIHLGSDHAGVELKRDIFDHLNRRGLTVMDEGPQDLTSVDYPDFAHKVCLALKHDLGLSPGSFSTSSSRKAYGILICGSGQGMAMCANKYSFVRAALCYNAEIARLSREHNDANILCLGSRFVTTAEALIIVDVFLRTDFAGGRHTQRISKISSLG